MSKSDFEIASELKRQGKLEDAISHYRLALENNPNFCWSYYQLGEILEQTSELNEAVEIYRKCTELNPNSSWFHYKLGLALSKLEKQSDALSNLEKAVKINPLPLYKNTLDNLILKFNGRSEKTKYQSKTEAGNFNISKVSFHIGGSSSKEKDLASDEVLGNRVLIGTHHKTGTVWMSSIFTSIASNYNLKYYANGGDQSFRCPSGNFDIFFQDHSLFDFDKLSNYKGLHIIRDPRDIIVSGCFYHTKSSEQWLHTKRKKFGGLTYQEKLNSYSSFDDKLMFEIENISKDTIQELESWNYNNPDFIEVKYEDLIEDINLNLFRNIFQFLGFNEKIMPHLLEIAYKNSLFSGRVSNTKHIRSGKKQQWQEYFKPIHAARFVALFGDILIKLNYDKTQTDWLHK